MSTWPGIGIKAQTKQVSRLDFPSVNYVLDGLSTKFFDTSPEKDSKLQVHVELWRQTQIGGTPVMLAECRFNQNDYGSTFYEYMLLSEGTQGDNGSTPSKIIYTVDSTESGSSGSNNFGVVITISGHGQAIYADNMVAGYAFFDGAGHAKIATYHHIAV